MDHPTIEEIEFMISPSESLSKTDLIEEIKKIISTDPLFADIDYAVVNSEYEDKIIHYLSILTFIISINKAIDDLNDFIAEFSSKSGITDTLYDVEDDDEYFTTNMFNQDYI